MRLCALNRLMLAVDTSACCFFQYDLDLLEASRMLGVMIALDVPVHTRPLAGLWELPSLRSKCQETSYVGITECFEDVRGGDADGNATCVGAVFFKGIRGL